MPAESHRTGREDVEADYLSRLRGHRPPDGMLTDTHTSRDAHRFGSGVYNERMTPRKNPHAVALSRKAAKARMKKLTPEQRREIARKAARARWAKRARQS